MRLRELQEAFVAALYDESSSIAQAIDARGGPDAAQRLSIYRTNLQAGFRHALALGFPVVAALCGPDFFRTLAREYQQRHPSRCGDLHGIGAPFAAHLRERFADGPHAWFADVAALEWAREEVARAADAPGLDVEALRAVPAEELAGLRLALRPAVHLLASRWAVFDIWRAHQPGGDPGSVDPGAGPTWLLLHRAGRGVALEPIGAADYRFLESLQAGGTFGEAFDAGLAADGGFDVAAALRRAVGRGLLADPQAASGSGAGRAIT